MVPLSFFFPCNNESSSFNCKKNSSKVCWGFAFLALLLLSISLLLSGKNSTDDDQGTLKPKAGGSSTFKTVTTTPTDMTKYSLPEKKRFVRFEKVVDESAKVLRYQAVYADAGGEGEGGGGPTRVTVAEWIQQVVSDGDDTDGGVLLSSMLQLLRDAPFAAYRFETPPCNAETALTTPFEFVLVEDAYLATFAAQSDPSPFRKHLQQEQQQQQQQCNDGGDSGGGSENAAAGCVFQNLGGDATLVAPLDWSSMSSWSSSSSSNSNNGNNMYGHLAAFVRGAAPKQVHQMWKLVAQTLQHKLLLVEEPPKKRMEPLWFSTAGTGVAWLHFRLEDTPKYYSFQAFKQFAGTKYL